MSRQLKAFPLTPEVTIRPDERGVFHYLSLIAGDRPGLLSRVARTLAGYDIQVQNAKINTLGARAEDVFLLKGDALKSAPKLLTDRNGKNFWSYQGRHQPGIGLNAVVGRPFEEYGMEPNSLEQLRDGQTPQAPHAAPSQPSFETRRRRDAQADREARIPLSAQPDDEFV